MGENSKGFEKPDWKIEKVSVRGLFGEIDHEFDMDERTSRAILIGPNGVGKTKLLNLVNALINLELSTLLVEQFSSVSITFDGDYRIECVRLEASGTLPRGARLILTHGEMTATWDFSRAELNIFEDRAGEHPLVRGRRRAGAQFWQYGTERCDTDRLIGLSLLDDELKDLGSLFGADASKIKQFLGQGTSLMVRTNRLSEDYGVADRNEKVFLGDEVRGRDDTIVSRIRREFESARLEYLRVSQELDSTFPARLLREERFGPVKIFQSETQLRAVYKKLGKVFSETTGTVRVDELEMAPLPSRRLEPWEIQVLNLHASDGLEKIRALTDLSRRIQVFESLVNSKLVRSRVLVKPEGLYLEFADGRLETPRSSTLSSGERHQIQMAFALVFQSREKRLVLIDEPELSLHVNWQNEILSEFEALKELNKFQYIVATHSPEIIGDAWGAVRALTLD